MCVIRSLVIEKKCLVDKVFWGGGYGWFGILESSFTCYGERKDMVKVVSPGGMACLVGGWVVGSGQTIDVVPDTWRMI